MPLFWFAGGSTSTGSSSTGTSTGPAVFSTGVITVSGTISGVPAGVYAISILPALSSNHKIAHADPLPSVSISSSSPTATANFATTYALGTRVVTW